MIGRGVILHIDSGGFLFVANGLDDFGVVQVGSGDPPKLTVNGQVTVKSGAQIEALGEGTQIQLSNVTLSNLGTIEAANLATITIDLKGDSTNAGVIEGLNGGVITLNGNGHGFTNQFLIEAFGEGTQIQLSDITLSNLGTIEAEALCNHHHRPQRRQHQRRRDRRVQRRSDHAQREWPRFHQSILDRGTRWRRHLDRR